MARLDLSNYKRLLRPLLPVNWADKLTAGKIGIGHDVATTEGELSNPSSLSVVERINNVFYTRLIMRWKAEEYKMRLALIELTVEDVLARHLRPRRLVIDATNERSFAGMVRDQLAGRCNVEDYIASKGIEHRGKKYSAKQLLGDLYVQQFEDNVMALPGGEGTGWVYADHQLVKASRGTYVYEEDSVGNHADAFVSNMLAVWSLLTGEERAEISAAGAGDISKPDRRGIITPPEPPSLLC